MYECAERATGLVDIYSQILHILQDIEIKKSEKPVLVRSFRDIHLILLCRHNDTFTGH